MSKLVNLSVSAAGRRFSIKLDEDTCNDAFEDIVLGLLGYDMEQEDTPKVQIEVDSRLNEPILHVEPKQEVLKEVVPQDLPVPATLPQRYKGFLYVECDCCKLRRGFHAKQEISAYRCRDCGGETPLEHMTPLRVRCECGDKFRYQTNVQDAMFDIACLNCGMPVSVEYHEKSQQYKTIGAR